MSGKANAKIQKQFLECYDRYANDIFRYCYYRIFDKDAAEDLVQEAYCRTWKYIIDGHNIQNIRAFIYKTARNLIVDRSRKHKSVSLDNMMEKGFLPGRDPRPDIENYFAGKEVISVIKSLDKKYRQVLLLKYVKDLSVKEISEQIHETPNNVYVRMSRGFKKVKKIVTTAEKKYEYY